MKLVICKMDIVGPSRIKFERNEIYEVLFETPDGKYVIGEDLVDSKYFDEVSSGIVVCSNGNAKKGLPIEKEYLVVGVLQGPTGIKGYYIADNDKIRCVSIEAFKMPEWFFETDEDNLLLGFTTEELIDEIERRTAIDVRIKKLIEIYGISSEAELEEIRIAAKAVYEYCLTETDNSFDAMSADLTEGNGLTWGLLALQVMEKSIEKNMSYEKVLEKYFMSADLVNPKVFWIKD